MVVSLNSRLESNKEEEEEEDRSVHFEWTETFTANVDIWQKWFRV